MKSEFITSFEINPPLSEIEFNLYEDTIEIVLDASNSLQFESKDNIINQIPEEAGNENINNIENSSETSNNESTSKIKDTLFSIGFLYNLLINDF